MYKHQNKWPVLLMYEIAESRLLIHLNVHVLCVLYTEIYVIRYNDIKWPILLMLMANISLPYPSPIENNAALSQAVSTNKLLLSSLPSSRAY